MSNQSFIVELSPSDPLARATRRIIIHADVLKARRITAGDVLGLTRDDSDNTEKVSIGSPYTPLTVIEVDKLCENQPFAIGVAWPSQEIPSDSRTKPLSYHVHLPTSNYSRYCFSFASINGGIGGARSRSSVGVERVQSPHLAVCYPEAL